MSNGMAPVIAGAVIAALVLMANCPSKSSAPQPVARPRTVYVPVPQYQQPPRYQQPQQTVPLVTCPRCKGTGREPGSLELSSLDNCGYCAGKGIIKAGGGNQGGFNAW